LERLVPVLNAISQKLNSEISVYNTQSPILDQSIIDTATGQWYSNIESKTRNEIDNYIKFTQADSARKRQLSDLINSQNPQQTNQTLTNLKGRLENYIQQFKRVEERFNNQEIEEIRNLRNRYESTSQAYNIATNELNGLNTIPGFGTNPWRTLWNAARDFAKSNGMTDNLNFPSNGSLERCVLCQQQLDESAQQRLLGFSRFILNDVSTQLSIIQGEIQQKVKTYSNLSIPAIENFMELNEYVTDFENRYTGFTQSINSSKNVITNYLQNGGSLNIRLNVISTIDDNLLPSIEIQLEQNKKLLNDRHTLVMEYNELIAKEFLFNNKAAILQYFDEYKYKSWIGRCQSQLNANIVSRKIGEFMEDQAVTLQHQEFINHLSFFNQDLSSKVFISKTRTTYGSTFQKCGFNGITHSIDSVLSEGEKKIIALSNFLADCTIDNRKNTIVFDDPVTSLDLDYRELIATKIVELSRDRQIIVLTHDLYFVRFLLDIHKKKLGQECFIVGVEKNRGVAGIVSDEIPYLAKNIQERINSIRRDLNLIDSLPLNQTQRIEEITEKLKKQFRKLLEKSVEDILANESIKRFSKNINLKEGYLSGYVIVEHSDIRLLLDLFGKYSTTEHDGGIEVQGSQIAPHDIRDDLRRYEDWKNDFSTRLSAFKTTHNYR
jgi:ABC-type nitrate/sulfonate/bicarbonate transport system ATPase subunit